MSNSSSFKSALRCRKAYTRNCSSRCHISRPLFFIRSQCLHRWRSQRYEELLVSWYLSRVRRRYNVVEEGCGRNKLTTQVEVAKAAKAINRLYSSLPVLALKAHDSR
jgi:hypothetical protein